MKVLLINGSPRREGNTFIALSEAARALEAEGVGAEIVSIGTKAVQGCIACGKCAELGRCVFNDALYNEVREKLAGADALVVGSPVYGGVMPLLVREYLAQYVTGEKTACILAAVYGNRNFDDCLVEMQDLMEENGFVVTAAAACIGEHSYSTAIASGRPNAQDLALAEEFGRQVAQKLSASPAVPTLAQTLPGSRPYRERKPSAPMAPQTTNGCIRCGMCVNNCPVGAIDRNDPTKVDASLCLRCLSCVRLCPLGSKAFTDPGFQKTVAWCLENFQKPDKSPAFFL